ncbi:hypothetical protein BGZ94_003384 [Podila epigama]|nr:hypothetical protein BGZ94_003384 [Podila epigama]
MVRPPYAFMSTPRPPGDREDRRDSDDPAPAQHVAVRQPFYHHPRMEPMPMSEMPQTYYFEAGSAVFEQGVPRPRRGHANEPNVPYMVGQFMYHGHTAAAAAATDYSSSTDDDSRVPSFSEGTTRLTQPVFAMPGPQSLSTQSPSSPSSYATGKRREDDSTRLLTWPQQRPLLTPVYVDPYPPDPYSRAQVRSNSRNHAAAALVLQQPRIARPLTENGHHCQTSLPTTRQESSLVRKAAPSHPPPRAANHRVPPVAPTATTSSADEAATVDRIDREGAIPPQPPVETYDDLMLPPGNGIEDDEMMEETDPVEVTLNVDVPRTSRTAEGKPTVTVLNVHSSWRCVFIESIRDQRVYTAVRLQFCVSPDNPTHHQNLVRQLRTLQIIGYESQQVEMSQQIVGAKLLERGGIIVHLDPELIRYNKDACYGFTISLSNYPLRILTDTSPDEPLPLEKQRHAAYCRRNLKELYYDTDSKDVAIYIVKPAEQRPATDSGSSNNSDTLQGNHGPLRTAPGTSQLSSSGQSSAGPTASTASRPQVLEVFYVHSVVLQSYEFFQSRYEVAVMARNQAIAAASASSIDQGLAQPLHVQRQQLQRTGLHAPSSSVTQPSSSHGPLNRPYLMQFSKAQEQAHPHPLNNEKIQLVFDNVQPNVFRAVLHFMYIGQIPAADVDLSNNHADSEGPSTSCSTTEVRDREEDGRGTGSAQSSTTRLPTSGSAGTFPPATASSSATTSTAKKDPFDFTWRDLFEASIRFDLKELTHMASVVLVTELRVDTVLPELFEWAYRFEKLVPLYIEFVVQHVPRRLLVAERQASTSTGGSTGTGMRSLSRSVGGQDDQGVAKSAVWQFRDSPAFVTILHEILRVLALRRPASSL